jgi:hypothetical protein
MIELLLRLVPLLAQDSDNEAPGMPSNACDKDFPSTRRDRPVQFNRDMVVSTPVFDRGYLLAGGLMFKLGSNSSDRKLFWPESVSPTKRIFSNTSTPLIQDNFIFTGTTAGKLICVDRETGKQLWETNMLTAPGNGSSLGHPGGGFDSDLDPSGQSDSNVRRIALPKAVPLYGIDEPLLEQWGAL